MQNQPMNIDQRDKRESYLFAAGMCLLLMVAFFVIEHNWDSSVYVMYAGEYTGAENRTGDAMGTFHGFSTFFRLLLAGLGIVALAFPNRYQINLRSPLFWV